MPADGVSVEPRLLGIKSIRFNIESAGWKRRKGANLLNKLLNPGSRNQDPIRPFEIALSVTNNSNVRINITDALSFDLHGMGRGEVYHLDQLGGTVSGVDAATDVVLGPSEARALTLSYKIDSRFASVDERPWSLRLSERVGDVDRHIVILKGPDKY